MQGAHHEAAVQVGVVGRKAQLASLLPALTRGGVLAQSLVRGVVVAVQEVAQAQCECLAGGVHVGGAVEGTQRLVVSGAVEALDGAVALGIPAGAVDQQGVQTALDHRQGVLGDEARTLVQVVQIRTAVVHDHFVAGRAGTVRWTPRCPPPPRGRSGWHRPGRTARPGAAAPRRRGSACRRRARTACARRSASAGCPPSRLCGRTRVGKPIRRQARHTVVRSIFSVDRDDAALARPAHQFRHRGARITLLLGAHKGDQLAELSATEVAMVRVRGCGSRAARLAARPRQHASVARCVR